MSARQSARLKGTASKAVAAAVTMITATTSTAARGAKRSVSTTTKKTKTKMKTETVVAAVASETMTIKEQNNESNDSPPSKKAKAAPKEKGTSSIVSGSAAKDAWGALFAKKSSASKSTSNGTGVKLKPAQAISSELQTKIDSYAVFEGLTPRAKAAKLKIVAWNVNGLRALLKKEETVHMRAYLAQEDPDVLCLSETKIDRDELQKLENVWPQYEHQYWSCAAKRGYAGTAILSKVKPLSVKDEIVVDGKTVDDEGRFLALEYDKFWLVHTYVPNAGQKLDRLDFRTQQWDQAMLCMLQELEKSKPVVWCGDLNVAHQEIDIHDPKSNRNKSPGFTDAERKSFSGILASGFVDSFRELHPDEQKFSYYSYRFNARAKGKGWRLDYFLVSQSLMSKVENSLIRASVTGSDHVPIVLELQEL